jgi:hypothetical protein
MRNRFGSNGERGEPSPLLTSVKLLADCRSRDLTTGAYKSHLSLDFLSVYFLHVLFCPIPCYLLLFFDMFLFWSSCCHLPPLSHCIRQVRKFLAFGLLRGSAASTSRLAASLYVSPHAHDPVYRFGDIRRWTAKMGSYAAVQPYGCTCEIKMRAWHTFGLGSASLCRRVSVSTDWILKREGTAWVFPVPATSTPAATDVFDLPR